MWSNCFNHNVYTSLAYQFKNVLNSIFCGL